MRAFLVALLAASFGFPVADVSAQVLEKAAPDEVHLTLTGAHRRCMTYARRIENSEPAEAAETVRAIESLGQALDAAAATLEDLVKAIPPGNEALLEQMRKNYQSARPHMDALNGLKEKPLSAAAKSHAAAVREQLGLAEDTHQKLMKALAAQKPEPPKPAATVEAPKPADTVAPPKPAETVAPAKPDTVAAPKPPGS